MKTQLTFGNQSYEIDFGNPLDIAIPIREGDKSPNCFYAPPFETSPVIAGDFVGSTAKGGPLNFLNIKLNPHGNGTHTECVGHISKEKFTINQCLKQFMFPAIVHTVNPTLQDNGDFIIESKSFNNLPDFPAEAIVIRTLPNRLDKLEKKYSGTNPCYVSPQAIELIVSRGIKHLLIDLPSVDREEDGGALLSHKAFWNYPSNPRTDATITELIFVPDMIKDGKYLLNIQIASFEIDVSPSKPILYRLW